MKRLIKILVSAGLIGALLWRLEWQEFFAEIRDIDPLLTGVAVALLTLQFPVSTWKWQISLAINGLDFEFTFLLKTLCIAFFFNNFLPTAIGGDAYRVWRTMNTGESKVPPVSAVLLERLLGLVALAVIGMVCAVVLLYYNRLVDRDLFLWGLLLAAGGLVIFALAYLTRSLHFLWYRVARIEKLRPLTENLRQITKTQQGLIRLIALSFLFQAIAVLAIASLFGALGIPGVIVESGFAAAASGIAAILPISVNGIGVIEGSLVLAALECGLPYAPAVVVAICLRGFIVGASVVCGLIYALEPKTATRVPPAVSG